MTENLENYPGWSFNKQNTTTKSSGKSLKQRRAYQHYQKCTFSANYNFIRSQIEGFTINFCCGHDPTGDVKVDLDKKMLLNWKKSCLDKADFVVADIHYAPFKPLCCVCAIADPPFSLYNRFKWALELAKLARKKVILSHPSTNLKLPGFTRELYFTNSKGIFLRLWWVFTRKEERDYPPI